MAKIKNNKKFFIISIVLTFLFLSTGIFNIQSSNFPVGNTYSIAYAKGSHFSVHGHSSGSFISHTKSSGGNFKSGSFSNTPNSSSKSSNDKANRSTSQPDKNYNNESRRSFLPIPIPIPWGYSSGYYGTSSLLASFFWGFTKFVILILIIIFIINRINKFKRKR